MLTRSSKRMPCPICGRNSDGDCRFNDELILCHLGSRFSPPEHLRIGDVVSINGTDWALTRTGVGYDGAAHQFQLHRPKPTKRGSGPSRRIRRRRSLKLIARSDLLQFLAVYREAMRCPEFIHCTPDELKHYFRAIDTASQQGPQLLVKLNSLASSDQSWRRYAKAVQLKLKTLGYQQADANLFRRNCLGEVLNMGGQDNVF
ncbi:hypothetical protein SynRCC2555_00798 [Synechococcus sp. WH 8101]|nr:hypothetical protein SynRCC2555_00798 [Synechococcus sp. WH 8101]